MLNFMLETIKYYPILSTIIGGFSLILIIIGLYHLWLYLFIKITPTTDIAKLKSGKSEIKGKVKVIKTVSTKQRKACFYRKVEERYEKKHWVKFEDNEEFFPFKVVDETGEVRVISESLDAFDLKCELIKHSNEYQTKHYYLEEGDDVYVLGNYYQNEEEPFIGDKDGMPFIISNIREEKLLTKHSYYAITTLFIALAFIGMSFYFAFGEWEKSWEGLVDRKYKYETSTKLGLDSEVHYMLKMKNKAEYEVGEEYYYEAIEEAYVIKHPKAYRLEVITNKNSPYIQKYLKKQNLKNNIKVFAEDKEAPKEIKKKKKRKKKKIKPKIINFK